MSNDKDLEAKARLAEQFLGTAQRRFPQGRLGGSDDGELAIAITSDVPHKVVRLEFGKPVEWIAMSRESTRELIHMLQKHLFKLEIG